MTAKPQTGGPSYGPDHRTIVRERGLIDGIEGHQTPSGEADACGLTLDQWASLLLSMASTHCHGAPHSDELTNLCYAEALPVCARGTVVTVLVNGLPYRFDPALATAAVPGSPEKLAVLAERHRMNLPCRIEGDLTWN